MVPKIPLWLLVTMTTLWSSMATQSDDLEPINEDNLDPDAAHVCQSLTQESYTALESFTQYYVSRTTTWCVAFPPRCTRYMILSRVAYRVATRYRQRKTYFCCDGYRPRPQLTYCIPKCAQDCNNHLGHGTCILPNTCVCNVGFRGNYCESSCNDGFWGQNCTQQCACSENGACDPESGNCVCHIGYTGNDCSTPCQDSFGLNCVHPCVCENNSTCNNINGKCTCKPGFYGAYCHKVCTPGISQEECQQVCQCENGGVCDDNLKCICKPGYKGEYCTDKCDSLHWGLNCSNLCECYDGTCDHVTGQCYCNMGYAGQKCEEQCKPGYYSYNCSTKCFCENGGKCYYGNQGQVQCNCAGTGYNGTVCTSRVCKTTEYVKPGTEDTCEPCQCPWAASDSCHPKTGVCDCKAGFRGAFCTETCNQPFWGKNCANVCQCPHGTCDIVTGECMACFPGYQGDNCDQPCADNKWGADCRFDCGCKNGAQCHSTTGYCNCTAGFHGIYCEDFCPENFYGAGCVNNCTCDIDRAICNPYTGQCQCKSGYYGGQCQMECEEGRFGFQCQHDCECNEQGTASCNRHTGECTCRPGWKGVTCNSQCPDGSWGVDCVEMCQCHPYGSCDQNTGECFCYSGYIGDNCQETCPSGYYGLGCTEPCPVCYEGTVCNFVTGECVQETCPPGLTGQGCQQGCRYGTWGSSCGQTCSASCLRNGYCHPVNGQCTCRPGFTGSQCESECVDGLYGTECNTTCQCVVSNTLDCHHEDGCLCKSGFRGERCEQECFPGSWGPECRLRCTDICETRNSIGCDKQRGLPCRCRSGYEGMTCSFVIGVNGISTQTGSSEGGGVSNGGLIGLAVLAAILVVAIIVVVIFFLRRQKRRDKLRNEMQVTYGHSNGSVPSTLANGTAAGVINPTYEEQNNRNELRFPRLEQRGTLPQPPRRRTCDEEFDDIVDAKLRVDMSGASRPTSGHYEDVDENRYTTLGSVMGDNARGEVGIPDWKYNRNSHHERPSNDYTFYVGRKGDQDKPVPRKHGGYVNGNYVSNRSMNPRTVSSPMYGMESADDQIIGQHSSSQIGLRPSFGTKALTDKPSDTVIIPHRGSTSTDTTNRKELMANETNNPNDKPNPANDEPNPNNDKSNTAYDEPSTTFDQPSTALDKSNPAYDKPKPASDNLNPDWDKPTPVYDKPDVAYDKPNSANDKPNSTYDKPNTSNTHTQLSVGQSGYLAPTNSVSGYLTPLNDINHPYQNGMLVTSVQSNTDHNGVLGTTGLSITDQNQNKITGPVDIVNGGITLNDCENLVEHVDEINEM